MFFDLIVASKSDFWTRYSKGTQLQARKTRND